MGSSEGDYLLGTQNHVKMGAADTDGRPFLVKDSDLLELCARGKKIITLNETGVAPLGQRFPVSVLVPHFSRVVFVYKRA